MYGYLIKKLFSNILQGMILKQITDTALIEKLNTKHKDEMSVFMLGGGELKGALFSATRFVNTLKIQHGLGIPETLLLGHASICAALLIPMMKGRDRIIFRYDREDGTAGFSAEAFSEGFVRGCLLHELPAFTKPPESMDLKNILGQGKITVIRFPEGGREPVTGIINTKHGNIAMDLSEYFLQSEQTQTGFNSGIQFDKDGDVIGAGGLYLQVMPGAGSSIIDEAEHAFACAPSLGKWFAEGGSTEDLIYGLFRNCNPEVLINRKVNFFCPCTKENFLNRILSLPQEELKDMYENGPDKIEVYCHNCGSVYNYPKEILKEKQGL